MTITADDPWTATAHAPTAAELAADAEDAARQQAANDFAQYCADLAERQAEELAAWVGALEGDGEPAC